MKVYFKVGLPCADPVISATDTGEVDFQGNPMFREVEMPVDKAVVGRWLRAQEDMNRAREDMNLVLSGTIPKDIDEDPVVELRKNLDKALSEEHKWHNAWYTQRDVTGEAGLRDMERWWSACEALIAILRHAREDPAIFQEVGKLALRDMTLRERLHNAGFHRGNWERLEQDSKP